MVVQHFAQPSSRALSTEQTLPKTFRSVGDRFDDPLAARIGAIDDVPRLKQLHRAAIEAPSLEAFTDLLDADE